MKNNLLIELSNKFIDNELSKDESIKLEELLKNKENKEYFDSLINTVKSINENKLQEKDVELNYIIMRRIMSDNKTIKEKIKKYFNDLLSGSLSSYAATFGFGGFFVLLIFMLLPKNSYIDDSFLQGTMGKNINNETYAFNEKSIEGEINVQYSDGVVVLDIDMTSDAIIDCELTINGDDFSIYGIKSLKQEGNKTFYLSGNTIRLNDINSNHYMVFLKNVKHHSGKVDVNFYLNNELINTRSLEIKN